MRFPWANVALVALFAFELVTGYLGLTHSNPEWIAAMHLHRITGFSILALFLWKSRNILGSFRTRQNWKASPETMLASIVLLAGLLTVLGLGVESLRPLQLAGLLRHHHPPEPGPAADSLAAVALAASPHQFPGALRGREAQLPALRRRGGGRAGAVAVNGPAEHPGRRPGCRPALHWLAPRGRPRLPGDHVAQRPHPLRRRRPMAASESTAMWTTRMSWAWMSCNPGTPR